RTKGTANSNNPKVFHDVHFSPAVNAALDKIPPGTILDEALFVKTTLKEVPPGYIYIEDLASVREGRMTAEGVRLRLEHQTTDDGRPLFRSLRTGTGFMQYVLADEGDRIIRQTTHDPNRDITRMELTNFLESQDWPRLSFDGFFTVCSKSGALY